MVCLMAFAGIHGVSVSRIRRIAESSFHLVCPPCDLRGKHGHQRRIPDDVKSMIDDHIRTFPVMKSHYSRSHHNKRRKYLSPMLTVADMHQLLLEKYEADANAQLVTYSLYFKYFNFEFRVP